MQNANNSQGKYIQYIIGLQVSDLIKKIAVYLKILFSVTYIILRRMKG
jgi:hypothetical protein